MDPLSIAAGAAGLATGCAAIIKTLYTWIDDTVDVDENVAGLCEEVAALSRVLESVSSTTASTPRVAIAQVDPDETLWVTVTATLDDIRSTLDKMNRLVADIHKSGSVFSRGFLRKPAAQIRFSLRAKDITTYKERVKSYNAAMTSALQMMNVCLLIHGQSSQDAVFQVLTGLQSQVRRVQVALHVGGNDGSAESREETARISKNLRQIVRVAENIQSSASTIVADGSRSTVYGGSIMGDPLTAEQVSSIQGWIPPPVIEEEEPGSSQHSENFHDQTSAIQSSDSDDDLDKDLVRRLQELAVTNMTKGDYPRAETFLRRAVERGESSQAPTTEILKMKLELSNAYIYQEKWTEAEDIISPIAFERKVAGGPVFHAMHAFAMVHVKNGNLEAADKCCKRALWGKRKLYGRSHPSCWETLELLAAICDAREDEAEAEAHRSFVPSTFLQPGKDEDALAYIKRVDAEEPESPPPRANISESASSSQLTVSSPGHGPSTPRASLMPANNLALPRSPGQSHPPQRPSSAQQPWQPLETPTLETRSQSISPRPVSDQQYQPYQPTTQQQVSRGQLGGGGSLLGQMAGLFLPRPRTVADLIIAVHFGTMETTVAYALVTGHDDQIHVIKEWPSGINIAQGAIPTVLYYDQWNKVVGWGQDIIEALSETGYPKPGVTKSEWFALDMFNATGTYADGITPPLPQGMDIVDVCADFLSRLRGDIEQTLQRTLGDAYHLHKRDVKWYFAEPLIAGPANVPRFQSSVARASFFETESDSVSPERFQMVGEPVAIIHHCLHAGLIRVKRGDVLVIAEMGGATTDFASFEVTNESPLMVQAPTPWSGDSCGSTALNRNFSNLLRQRIMNMGLSEGSQIAGLIHAKGLVDFDKRIKHDFCDNGYTWACDVNLDRDYRDVGINDGYMVFLNEEILSCFDPVVRRILNLIGNQIVAINAQGKMPQKVILSGSFAANEYLFQRIQQHVPPQLQDHIIRPVDPRNTVVQGLVAGAMSHLRVETPVARPFSTTSTILVDILKEWDEWAPLPKPVLRTDAEAAKLYRRLPDGKNYTIGATAPLISAGDVIRQTTEHPMRWFYQPGAPYPDIGRLVFRTGLYQWLGQPPVGTPMTTDLLLCKKLVDLEVDLTLEAGNPDAAFRKFYGPHGPYFLIEYSLWLCIRDPSCEVLEVRAMFKGRAVSETVHLRLNSRSQHT